MSYCLAAALLAAALCLSDEADHRSGWHAGAFFNRAKILGMLGREAEAQEAYRDTIDASHGAAPGSYAKALASLSQYDDQHMTNMEEAVRFIELSSGEAKAAPAPHSCRTFYA